jgi:hypothetical protein
MARISRSASAKKGKVPRKLGPAMAVRRKKTPEGNLRWSVLYPMEGFAIEVTMTEVYGRPEIVGLAIDPLLDVPVAPGGAPPKDPPTIITGELLRLIPLSKLKAACLADLASEQERPFLETVSQPPKRGQAPIPIERIKRAASEYQQAIKELQNPIRRIEDEMGVKPPTARKYVARARQLGLLAYPERPGVAGASNPRSPITGRTPSHQDKENK